MFIRCPDYSLFQVTHQMKSLQWLQKVGCLKNLGMKRWLLTSEMFFFLSAPIRSRALRGLCSPSPSPLLLTDLVEVPASDIVTDARS